MNNCYCATCTPNTMDNMRMILCATCGNKRCPHATDHRFACTGSNEPGQPGSSYGAGWKPRIKLWFGRWQVEHTQYARQIAEALAFSTERNAREGRK